MKKIVLSLILVLLAGMAVAQTTAERDTVVKCAQDGDAKCQNLLGKWIFEGSHGYQQDYGKAVQWWLLSAKQDNVEAVSNLGFCYLYGLGVEADSSTATRLFEKALKQGNDRLVKIHDSLANEGTVFSAMLLARCYKMAYGVKRDAQMSLKYYKIAAEKGNVDAMREAAILMRGNKDYANAYALFNKAMQKNDVASTYYCGKMLCEGVGTSKDTKKGLSCLQNAADKDYAAAQYELAEIYSNGNGVDKDDATALKWYYRAALNGNRTAWWQLGEAYRLGHGTAVNYEEALEFYAKAYIEGYHNKLNALLSGDDTEWKDSPFMHYLRGMRMLTVDGNPAEALKEFGKLPKDQNDRVIMEAMCLMHPKYAKRNEKKAVKKLQASSGASYRAQYELALMQISGNGMDKDKGKAEKSLVALAGEGYALAINYLADAYYDGTLSAKDRRKAALYYLRAEKLQRLSAVGATRMADYFRNGTDVKANKERAEQFDKYRAYEVSTLLKKVK